MPEPLAPVIATRSPQSTCRSTGPSVNAAAPDDGAAQGGDDRAGAGRGGDLHPQLPLLARLLDDVEPLDPPVGLPGLGGLLLRRRPVVRLDVLVAVLGLLDRVADALGHPVALHPGPRLEPRLRVGVLLVLLAGVPPGDLPLVQVGVVAAAVDADQLLGEVELDDPGDGAGQELAVVADDHDARPASPSTNRSSWSSPARSRSLVGSSSSRTS